MTRPVTITESGVVRFVAVSLAVPLSCIAAAYTWLAVDHKTWALGNVVVHEGGLYTLKETVFYFSHFLREIPVDVAMAMFLVAALNETLGPLSDRPGRTQMMIGVVCALTALGLAFWAFAEAAGAQGAESARLDLFQFRTRDDTSAYGSHWHYHLASTAWFGLGTPLAARWLAAVTNTGLSPAPHPRGLWIAAWGLFAMLTLIFGASPLAMTSALYAGHQARELLTHVPITMPLVFASLAALHAGPTALAPSRTRLGGLMDVLRGSPLRTLGAVALPIILTGVALSGDVMAEGQSGGGLTAMIAGHVFEHALDYAFTTLVAVAIAIAITATAQHR